jgi:uncharacterized protein
MTESSFRLDYRACLESLLARLTEPAPGRIQLLSGPRQVGKTTLLLELARKLRGDAIYAAADGPEAALPGYWDRLWAKVEERAAGGRRAVLLLDEAHLVPDWAARLKGQWDRLRRRRLTVHIVATGSSALRLASGSRESLAGRFERLTLTHWSAASLAQQFRLSHERAAEMLVRTGSYPGAFGLRAEPARFLAYVRDSILEPAIGRDIVASAAVRRPALLRQVFAIAASSPAQILSLQKIQGQLQDRGALETIAQYLTLIEEAFLVAALPKHAGTEARRRAAPPKLVTLNNALLAAVDPAGPVDPGTDPRRFGAWVENACLAHAWNAGQRVSYWREEPFEVDGILEGSWGSWAIEVKTGRPDPSDLRGLDAFVRRHPRYRPLVVADGDWLAMAERLGLAAIDWRRFLFEGPPRS